MYKSVALQGDSAVPTSAEAEVDVHYVKSHRDSHLYEMDGDRNGGPVDLGGLEDDDDVLAEAGLSVEREKGGRDCFSGRIVCLHVRILQARLVLVQYTLSPPILSPTKQRQIGNL